ncbi:MAG: capsule assembly Wzi family protein, partial [Steroidobacteraceae bacterium]
MAFLLCATLGITAHAAPWLEPGDVALRADIETLADRGILRGPITTWPISWPDVARDVLEIDPAREFDPVTGAALARVQGAARRAMHSDEMLFSATLRGAEKPIEMRTFEATPRAEGELTLGASWMSDRFAVNLEATGAANPSDDQSLRPDGSYIGVNVANFMISAGYQERWWGPGWEGSL